MDSVHVGSVWHTALSLSQGSLKRQVSMVCKLNPWVPPRPQETQSSLSDTLGTWDWYNLTRYLTDDRYWLLATWIASKKYKRTTIMDVTHLHLMPRLRISGAVPWPPPTPSWPGKGLYISRFETSVVPFVVIAKYGFSVKVQHTDIPDAA
jgi:hypothetical protein